MIPNALFTDLSLIRARSPLVLNLTNFVAMEFSADALLALGASPIMSVAREEMEELVRASSSVVINTGTLDLSFLETAFLALSEARRLGKPVVLDPVGAGATRLRTEAAQRLFREGVSVVRGNASEIAALLGEHGTTRGVDSSITPESIEDLVLSHSMKTPSVLVVSGPVDLVFQQGEKASVPVDNPMMTRVTAMGCVASSLIGAFLAVDPSPFHAALNATWVMAKCGERVGNQPPGTFRVSFIDALSGFVQDEA